MPNAKGELRDSEGRFLPMFIGRTLGWTMVAMAIIMASSEALMALSAGSYHGLATSDVWALLWGQSPDFLQGNLSENIWRFLAALVLAMPAWAVIGPSGIILAHACRKRPPKGRLFRVS